METERGNINREIKAQNKLLAELKEKISALKKWLEELFKHKKDIPLSAPQEQNPVELIRQMQGQRQSMWNKIYVLKDTAAAVAYLQNNGISTLTQLREQTERVNAQFYSVRKELKAVEEAMSALSEKVKHTDIYLQHKDMYKQYMALPKGKDEYFRLEHFSEILLYETAVKYLKEHLTDNRIYLAEWKAELKELADRKEKLYVEYYSRRDESKLLDGIKRSCDSALRQQNRQTRKRNLDYER